MSGQLGFILRRVALTIPTLFVMSIVVFLIIRLVPGDPVRTMLGFRATDANVAELRHQLGLDESLFTQYVVWAGKLLHGDLGMDIVSHAPLSELLAQRLPVTFELTGLSMLLAVAGRRAVGGLGRNRRHLGQAVDRGLCHLRHRDPGFLAGDHAGAGLYRDAGRPAAIGLYALCQRPHCQPALHGAAGADTGDR